MIDINIDSAAENFDVIFDSCVKSDSIYRIKTHKGSIIMLSEKRYKKMLKESKIGRASCRERV